MAHDRDLPQLAVETALPKRAHKRRGQAGQTLPMVMFFMVALLGVAGLVVDVGGWYLQKRQVQAAADASALAGANQLPAGWSWEISMVGHGLATLHLETGRHIDTPTRAEPAVSA